MERRMLLAVVLSFLAVMSYSAITGRGCMAPPKPPPEEPPAGEQPADPDAPRDPKDPAKKPPAQPPGGAPAPAPGPAPADPEEPPADAAPHPQADAPLKRIVLESEEIRLGLTTEGAAVEFLQLKGVRESGKEHEFDLLLPANPLNAMGVVDDTGLEPDAAPGGKDRRDMPAGPMRTLNWTAVPDEGGARFEFETPEGLVYSKRYSLAKGEGRFDVHYELSVRAARPTTRKEVVLKLLVASGQMREKVEGAFATPSGVIYRLSGSQDISPNYPWGLSKTDLQLKGLSKERLELLGTRSAYFMSAYFAKGEDTPAIRSFWATGEDASQRENMEERLQAYFDENRGRSLEEDAGLRKRLVEGVLNMHHAWVVLSVPIGEQDKPTSLDFYNGPISREVIRGQDAYEPINPVFTWPSAFDFIAEILLWIYDFWRNLFGSAGLAVILMTVVVRGAMIPLSVRNQLSMRKYGRKVAKLKPKVAALQQRFANNPKRLREEQMKLYREHGVGFPTGCLMMLIQIPIFFALFSSLRVEYTIRGAEFLWISDLSGPDKLIDFGTRLFDIGILYVESLNILPLLMVALSILHTRNMPKPADEQQAQQMKMMKWLPIVFAVILYNYTAALALYMVLSSAVAILESKIVRAKDEAETAGDAAPA
jgi:YidC/Oxa1 family membrane protein insertase